MRRDFYRKFLCRLSVSLLCAVVIDLLLLEIGNTHDNALLRRIYFIKLDFSHVIPTTVHNAALLNAMVSRLGLSDFYQAGLWNYCHGSYKDDDTSCSKPKSLYWFNPVAIVHDQVMAGAHVHFPPAIEHHLDLIHTASKWMFSLFLLGICLSTILIPFCLPSSYGRRTAGLVSFFAFLNAATILVASTIATALFVIMRNKLEAATEFNIKASVGAFMLVFMWEASAFTIVAFIARLGVCCFPERSDIEMIKELEDRKTN